MELTLPEPIKGHNSNGWLPALTTNISLEWKQLKVANTLAYYDAAKNTAVKVLEYRPSE
jgi:hypothetical protein